MQYQIAQPLMLVSFQLVWTLSSVNVVIRCWSWTAICTGKIAATTGAAFGESHTHCCSTRFRLKQHSHFYSCTKFKCRSRLIVKPGSEPIKIEEHSHGPETEKISWGRTVMENVRAQTAGQKDMVFRMRQPHCKVDYVKKQKK